MCCVKDLPHALLTPSPYVFTQGLLFPVFQWTTRKTNIPLLGTIITGLFTAVIAFFMTLDILADAISIGTLMAFNLVCAGVMILRYKGGRNSYIPVAIIIAFVIMTFLSAMAFVRDYPFMCLGFLQLFP